MSQLEKHAMASSSDPWDWTVGQVVDALCTTRMLWHEGRPDSRLPSPEKLEQIIRENDINGSTLLTDVDTQVLKDHLGIQSLGQRSALMYAIQRLRQQSLNYTNYSMSVASQQQRISTGTLTPNFSMQTFNTPLATQSPVSILTREMPPPQSFQRVEPRETPEVNENHLTQDRGWTPGSRARPGEVLTEVNGRKRRKLVLGPELDSAIELPSGASQGEWYEDTGPSQTATTSAVGADDPVNQRHDFSHTEAVQRGVSRSTASKDVQQQGFPHKNAFLGEKKLPVDEIFYGKSRVGQPLEHNIEPQGLPDYEEDDVSFSVVSSHERPEGYRQYVYSQLRHFLHAPERVEMKVKDRNATVIYPYRETISKETQRRSALLFQETNSGSEVTRGDPLMMDSNVPYDENSNHDWDFLSRWAKEDGKVLPAFGDSGSEGEYTGSILDEFEAEEKEAEEAAKQKKGPLTAEAVAAIIDQCIGEFVDLWKRKKMPLRESTAWTVWRRGRRRHTRLFLVNTANQEIENLNKRLAKLEANLVQEVWKNEAEIRKQCAILELSVFQREEERWKISVWERQDAPARPATKPRTRKRAMSVHASDEEGVELGSDSEFISDGEVQHVHIEEIDMTEVVSPSAETAESRVEENSQSGEDAMDTEGRSSRYSLPYGGQDGDNVLDAMSNEDDYEHQTDDLPHFGEVQPDGMLPRDESDMEPLPTAPNEAPPQNQAPATVIDLTYSSDVDATSDNEATSKAYASFKHLSSQDRGSSFSTAPEKSSDDDILNWSWEELEERSDRKRLILKILREKLSSGEYSSMRNRILNVRERDFNDEIKRAFGAMVRKVPRMAGTSDQDFDVITKFVRLYVCWGFCSQQYWKDDIPVGVLSSFLATLDAQDVEQFYRFVRAALTKDSTPILPIYDRRKQTDGNSQTRIFQARTDSSEDSVKSGDDDSEEPVAHNTPHKTRKRTVQRSTAAFQKRANALARQQEQSLREQDLSQRMGVDLMEGNENIIINPMENEENLICINSQISSKIKQHQVEGVRFMWREVVTAGKVQSEMEGCLLAHTMGLGKTMQVITLLVTMAEAAKSRRPRLSHQIPESLREPRVLVICPASLIVNWRDEFSMWLPERGVLGQVRSIDAEYTLNVRLEEISEWHEHGGVMIISYDMLRSIILNKATKSRPPALDDDQHSNVRKQLLEGPGIIVADEAHTLKNTSSAISQVTAQFRSRSRLALTGSPLANNLQEYYAMINWIAPGYLGEYSEFKAHYQEPIEEGLYLDSTAYERRRAMKMLRVLMSDIAPKIHRADITVLKGDLKPKVEFLITVPLTKIQEEAYRLYVRSLTSGIGGEITNARMWSWLGVLSLLCNHPKAFLDKLTEVEKPRSLKTRKASLGGVLTPDEDVPDSPEQQLPDDVHVSRMGISEHMIKEQEALFASLEEKVESIRHSYKVEIFLKILRYSKKAGDRVLVFSQSIPTLNFLRDVLDQNGIKYERLDGSTKMSSRQNMAKDFNKGPTDVFLISTRAGGLGFNLPGANRVIIFDFRFNPTWEEQAIGRVYRIGQEKPVFVYRFVAGGTFETKVHNKAVYKTQLAYRVVERKNPRSLAEKSRDFLFEPKPVPQESLDEHKGKDPAVLDRILASYEKSGDPHIRSITTTETLQEDAGDDLTAEEQKEVDEMIGENRLKKHDPEAWRAKQNARAWRATQVPVPSRTYTVREARAENLGLSNASNPPTTSTQASGPQSKPAPIPVASSTLEANKDTTTATQPVRDRPNMTQPHPSENLSSTAPARTVNSTVDPLRNSVRVNAASPEGAEGLQDTDDATSVDGYQDSTGWASAPPRPALSQPSKDSRDAHKPRVKTAPSTPAQEQSRRNAASRSDTLDRALATLRGQAMAYQNGLSPASNGHTTPTEACSSKSKDRSTTGKDNDTSTEEALSKPSPRKSWLSSILPGSSR